MSGATRQVLIVGRDAPVWLAALFLQRALAPAGVEVAVVELPSSLHEVDVYTALPSIGALHNLIGLDEAAVLTAAAGVPMVAQRFVDWGGAHFLQGFDNDELPGRSVSFVQLWAKARLAGMAVPFQEFSYGAMAARQGRVPGDGDGSQSLGATYGYHLDAIAYSLLLRALSERRGIRIHSSASVRTDLVGDRITAVELDNGVRLQADLFVDASGAEGSLISRLPGDDTESWLAFLPCDRLVSAAGPALNPQPAFSQITAFGSGWIGQFPLYDRTAVIAAFPSSEVDALQVASAVQSVTGVAMPSGSMVRSLNPGCRQTPWIGNCVAIGEAAAVLEPLDGLHLHMTHVCLAQLVNFFPVGPDSDLEAEEFGKVVRRHASNLRDFQQSHYKLNGRLGQDFWDRVRAATVSVELAQKLRMFEARGAAVLYDYETFEAHSWASMFVGHGLLPASYDPGLDLMSEQDHIRTVQNRLREIGSDVPTLPTVATFLTQTRIPIQSPTAAKS